MIKLFRGKILLLASVLAPIALVAVLLAYFNPFAEPRQLAGYLRHPTPNVAEFALPIAGGSGDLQHMKAEPGELMVVFFGFTHCPDICPTSLADVAHAKSLLGNDGSRIKVAFATVDPERDAADVLKVYVSSFLPADAVALRTEDQQLLGNVTEGFGATYSVFTDSEGEIEVEHTASSYILDSQGDLILTWPFGVGPLDMADDLATLLRGQ